MGRIHQIDFPAGQTDGENLGHCPYDYYFSGASNADLQLYSAITIDYIEPVNQQVKQIESYPGVMNGRILAKAIEGGVQITYCFDKQQIAVPVQYLLRDDSLEIRIMVADIIEGDNEIYQIKLAPFLASVANDTPAVICLCLRAAGH